MDEEKQESKRVIVHLRVEADFFEVDKISETIADLLVGAGYELIERSSVRPHRWEDQQGQVFMTVR